MTRMAAEAASGWLVPAPAGSAEREVGEEGQDDDLPSAFLDGDHSVGCNGDCSHGVISSLWWPDARGERLVPLAPRATMRVFPSTRALSTVVSARLRGIGEIDVIMRSFPVLAAILGLTAALLGSPRAHAAGPIPDAADAVTTYFAARAWLDRGGTGTAVVAPADVGSAAVVLRLQGRPVGFGKDDGAAPTTATVDRALRMALDDARTRRTELSKGTGSASLGALVTLELEIAGSREPLIGRTFEEVARSIEPGECGLLLTDANRTSYEPASFLLSRRMASPVSRAVLAMVTDLRLDRKSTRLNSSHSSVSRMPSSA